MIHQLAKYCSTYILDLALILAFIAVCVVIITVISGIFIFLRDYVMKGENNV